MATIAAEREAAQGGTRTAGPTWATDADFRAWLAGRLSSESDPTRLLKDAAEGLGRHLNVARVAYAAPDLDRSRITVLLQSPDDAAGHAIETDSPVAHRYRAGKTMVVADGAAAAEAALVGVPLLRDGELVAVFSVHDTNPREWTPAEVALVDHVATCLWRPLDHHRTVRRLRDTDAQFRTLAENMPGICWLAGTDGRLYWMNGRGLDFYGRLGGEPLGGAHPDDLPAATALWEKALANGTPVESRVRLRGQDGVYRPFVSRAEPIRDASGSVLRWCGMQLDLGDQHRRDRHDALFRAVSDALREETDAARLLTVVAAMLRRHLGVARVIYAEVIDDRGLFAVRHDIGDAGPRRYRLPPAFAPMLDTFARGETVSTADVTELAGPVTAAVRDHLLGVGIRSGLNVPLVKEGRLVALLSVLHDATRPWTREETALVEELAERIWSTVSRALAEAALQERERAQAFLIAWWDAVRHLSGMDELLRTTLTMLGTHLSVTRMLYAETGEADDRLVELARWGQGESIAGARPTAELGSGKPLVVNDAGADARFGKPGAVVGVPLVRDRRLRSVITAESDFARDWTEGEINLICEVADRAWAMVDRARFEERLAESEALLAAERKEAEVALQRSRDALYQSEKLSALGSLLAGVSHELNNPLSIVVAQAVMMERQSAGTELAERAQKIRKAADRCARIVQTFLAMARQKKPERTAVDLNAVADAAIELAGYGLRADGIGITRAFTHDLPRISADSDQLHQIVTNLIVNAQQAMASKNNLRWLEVRTALGPEPRTVILEVADSGPGIPPEARRRVFEPFYTTKAQGEGTGVGLSFSQGLAEAHGGRLTLVPSERGACFRLTLPMEERDLLLRVEPVAARPGPTGTRRALIVDDEEEIALSLADFLSLEDFSCDVVVGGAAAQARLAEGGAYDLIVSDLRMPDVDGPALFAWIADRRPELAPRVAFTTGDTLGAAAARFLADAGRPVLEKPFMPDSVRRFLGEVDVR